MAKISMELSMMVFILLLAPWCDLYSDHLLFASASDTAEQGGAAVVGGHTGYLMRKISGPSCVIDKELASRVAAQWLAESNRGGPRVLKSCPRCNLGCCFADPNCKICKI